MARALTYEELKKNNNIDEKELLRLKGSLHSLHPNLAATERHHRTHEAVVECVTLLLRQEKFICIAKEIFSKCQEIVGATAGFVALLEESGKRLDVLHLDTGELPCTVNSDSPMPIRGLRKETLQKGVPLCCNNFTSSKWLKFLPKGHMQLQNVLFAPLVIEQIPVGLLGFANKPTDFDLDDMRIATSFARLASLALSNSKAWRMMNKKPRLPGTK